MYSMDGSKFKSPQNSGNSLLSDRRMISWRLNQEYPDRVPVVVWPMREPEDLEECVSESRFLVARSLTIGHFTLLLRELLELGPHAESPLFIWCGDQLLTPLLSFRFIEEKFLEADGFVYLYISDLGGSPEELKNLGTPAEKSHTKTAGQDRVVDLFPPELIFSLPRLRYPSPPEPDETLRTHGSVLIHRTSSEVSQTSALTATASATAILPAPVLPPLRVRPQQSADVVHTRPFRGPPRPAPPSGLTPQVPSPPPSHMESCASLFDDQAAARGAGLDFSDEEDTGYPLRLEELQSAVGLRPPARSLFTADPSHHKDSTSSYDHVKAHPFEHAEPPKEKSPLRVPAWLREPGAAIQF